MVQLPVRLVEVQIDVFPKLVMEIDPSPAAGPWTFQDRVIGSPATQCAVDEEVKVT